MEEYLEKYRIWLVMKNYAKRTQKCYLSALKNYWIWCEKMQKSNPQFKQKDAVQTQIEKFTLCYLIRFCIKRL